MSRVLMAGMILLVIFHPIKVRSQYTPVRTVQPQKSLLFSSQPDSFRIALTVLQKLFSLSPGDKIQVPLNGGEALNGTITESVKKNEHVNTVNIKATNYQGALLTVSRIKSKDQADRYIGRIVNIKYGDAFVLKREGDQYSFSKVQQSHLVTE